MLWGLKSMSGRKRTRGEGREEGQSSIHYKVPVLGTPEGCFPHLQVNKMVQDKAHPIAG